MIVNRPKCCKIEPPPAPVYDSTGHLIGYRPTSCPTEYLVIKKKIKTKKFLST